MKKGNKLIFPFNISVTQEAVKREAVRFKFWQYLPTVPIQNLQNRKLAQIPNILRRLKSPVCILYF